MISGTSHAQLQDTHLYIIDDSTGDPIEFAFVFLENTTFGGNTDTDGHISFEAISLSEHIIVVTHLLYKEVRLKGASIKENGLEIRLQPKSFDLTEVVVREKRKKNKNYKKWMKRFEEAFIGNRKVRRKVKLLNPEVIWFEEKEDTLHAYAVDNIRLRNELTGYEMHIALSKFTLSKEKDITYRGSIYYDDITDELKKPESVKRKRQHYFQHSRQLFFKSLFWKHPVLDEEFTFGITHQKDDGSYVYQDSKIEELKWKRGIYADTLSITDYMTVTVKDKITEAFKQKGLLEGQRRNAIGTSFLLSKTGTFVVNKNGYLLNQADIEESGYWTNLRMAYELPSDYVGDIYFHQEASIAILDELQQYNTNYHPEKIYVHTDKSTYMPLEHIWFKAYLVNAVDHSADTQSNVVYVDLVDEKGKIVNQWLLHTELGLTGDMKWTPDYMPGTYLMRAYTNHMRNQGEEFFFEKEIILTSLQESPPLRSIQNALSEIRFFPEGGDLITGVSCQVAFVATDSIGMPIDISGVIKDGNGDIVTECQTTHRGIGVFQLSPHPSMTYYLEASRGNTVIRYDLPTVLASGLSLRINANDEDDIFIDVLADNVQIHKDAFIIGHMRGKVFAFTDNLSVENPLRISKSSIPPGVVHFTVFDQYERPQAERLIFNDRNYEKQTVSANNVLLDDDSHTMTFTIDSLYIDESMNLSLSIVDKVHYPTALEEQNITSYLHLNSDLASHIQGLNSYLQDIDNSKRYYLDLILRTQAWRRFTWRDLADRREQTYPIESGYSITGQITEKENDTPIPSSVMITDLSPDAYYDNTVTNDNGTFAFTNLNDKEGTTYIIQAREGAYIDGTDVIELKGDRLVDIEATPQLGVPYTGRSRVAKTLPETIGYEPNNMAHLMDTYVGLQNTDTTLWQLDAPEVTIRGKKARYTSGLPTRAGLIFLDNADWIAPSSRGVDLLNKVAPGRRFHFGSEGKLLATIINTYGETVVIPAQVIIDGIGAEPGGSTATTTRLRMLPADRIASIYVGGAKVIVNTRAIPRSVEKELDSGIIYIDHPGYYQAREFSKIREALRPQLMSTVVWDPNVAIDEDGKIQVSIDKDLHKEGYIVVLEGVSLQGDIINFRKKFVQ